MPAMSYVYAVSGVVYVVDIVSHQERGMGRPRVAEPQNIFRRTIKQGIKNSSVRTEYIQ